MFGILLSIIATVLFALIVIGKKEDFHLWLIVFSFYLIYMTLTNLFVKNPLVDYFVSLDQLHLYEQTLSLSHESFKYIVDNTFGYAYIQTPLTYFTYAYILKFAHFIGVTNDLYYLKLTVVFLGSLIFPIMAKIIRYYGYEGKQINKQIILFAILSPILCFSCQIVRDAQICLLFTLMFFVVVKPSLKFRWIWLVLLIVITYFYRYENGLFSLLFVGLLIMKNIYQTKSIGNKMLLFIGVLVGVVVLLIYVESVMTETFDAYNARSLENADEGSLGAKLGQLPFPFNVLGKTAFGQLFPFPCWAPLVGGQDYAFLRITECFFPFFWIPVLLSLFYSLVFLNKKIPSFFIITILFGFGYIILTSSSAYDTRRVMAAYPMLYSIFLVILRTNKIPKDIYNKVTIFGLFALYLIYFILKG